MMANFADRLKIQRKRLKLSQVELAGILNVSGGAVAMWETGKREPSYAMLRRLTILFNQSADYLLGFSDEERSTK